MTRLNINVDVAGTETEKKYVKLTYEDVKAISDEIIGQNMEAYIALANS